MRSQSRRRGGIIAATASIAALTLLVSGCTSSDPDPGEAGTLSGTLTVWGYTQTDPGESEFDLYEEFQAAYPDIDLKLSTYGPGEYDAKLLSAFSSGGEPDVFTSLSGEVFEKYVRTGKVAPLEPLVDTHGLELGHFSPQMVEGVRSRDGGLYAVPYFGYALLMFGNQDLLAELGTRAPGSWEDLLKLCEGVSAQGVVPIALGAASADAWVLGNLHSEMVYQYAGSDGLIDATYGIDGASWSDDEFVKSAERIIDMMDAGCFSESVTGLSYSQMTSQFLGGNSPLIYVGSWLAATIMTSDVAFTPEVSRFPSMPGASNDGVVAGLDTFAASQRAVDEKADHVVAFLNFIGENSPRIAANGHISAAAEQEPLEGLFGEMNAIVTEASGVGNVTDGELPAVLIPGYLDNLLLLISGELNAQEFADAMQTLVESKASQLPDIG